MAEHQTKPAAQPDPPVTPEVEREVRERLRPERYEEERKSAKPASAVMNRLRAKYTAAQRDQAAAGHTLG